MVLELGNAPGRPVIGVFEADFFGNLRIKVVPRQFLSPLGYPRAAFHF